MARHNKQNKSIDIEVRDINYILGAYIKTYLFDSGNQDPEKIIFPMYPVVPHPYKPNVLIPIEYIPPTDQFVVELAKDGSNIPEVTPTEEAALDKLDKKIEEVKKDASIDGTEGVHISPAQAALKRLDNLNYLNQLKQSAEPEVRIPKMPPGGDIGAGHPDNLGSRDVKLERQIRQDLMPEPDIDESEEVETNVEKPAV